MPNNARVCFIWTSPDLLHLLLDEPAPVGGAEIQLRELGRHLRSVGWDVSFVVGDCGQPDGIVNADGFTLYRSYPARKTVPVADVFATKMPRLAAAMRRADADVYIQRGAAWLTGHGLRVARQMGRGFVFWIANLNDMMSGALSWRMPRYARRLYAYGLSRAELVLAQTEEQRALLLQTRGIAATIVPNLCELPAAIEAKAASPSVLWVGNISARKRPEWLLQIARECPGYEFTMVGGQAPGAASYLETVRSEAALLPNVRFLGRVDPEAMTVHYARAWVLASTSEAEGFSNALLHAWAAGTPTVAMLDPDHVIDRHQMGYHCASLEDVVARVRYLCDHETERAAKGANARAYVAQHHAPQVVIPGLDRELRRLIKR